MEVTNLCRSVALREVFERLGATPGQRVPYFHIIRYWRDTGLRQADLETAVVAALAARELIEQYSDEGRLLMYTELAEVNSRYTLDTQEKIERFSNALAVLEQAHQRKRGEISLAPRASDLPAAPAGARRMH